MFRLESHLTPDGNIDCCILSFLMLQLDTRLVAGYELYAGSSLSVWWHSHVSNWFTNHENISFYLIDLNSTNSDSVSFPQLTLIALKLVLCGFNPTGCWPSSTTRRSIYIYIISNIYKCISYNIYIYLYIYIQYIHMYIYIIYIYIIIYERDIRELCWGTTKTFCAGSFA